MRFFHFHFTLLALGGMLWSPTALLHLVDKPWSCILHGRAKASGYAQSTQGMLLEHLALMPRETCTSVLQGVK